MQQLDESLEDEELALLDDLLLEYGTERENGYNILSLSELDGLLTAILSSPELVAPNQWLPAIFDENAQESIPDENTFNLLLSLIFRHYNDVIQRLNSPLFYAYFDEGIDDFVILDSWCSGYIFGAKVSGWGNLPNKIQGQYDLIRSFAYFKGDDLNLDDHPSAKETQERAAKVEQAVMAIYQYFLTLRNR
ncbi:UPF0149 family protein [Pasteurellaceae bacterium USgator11]|nr:UPF0149 family protein [Pasteurellaceae bacterium USgator41]TNG95609.1 UPF0149 family protein [Pasteurellaceae bacterium UScroc12]TNH00632.1 UPF0149 family protein [Pasteurellaceae bacterium USgator11]TNH01197.1 UPF0149 family protein [Pasteurellaceae bacterium UScroc31]